MPVRYHVPLSHLQNLRAGDIVLVKTISRPDAFEVVLTEVNHGINADADGNFRPTIAWDAKLSHEREGEFNFADSASVIAILKKARPVLSVTDDQFAKLKEAQDIGWKCGKNLVAGDFRRVIEILISNKQHRSSLGRPVNLEKLRKMWFENGCPGHKGTMMWDKSDIVFQAGNPVSLDWREKRQAGLSLGSLRTDVLHIPQLKRWLDRALPHALMSAAEYRQVGKEVHRDTMDSYSDRYHDDYSYGSDIEDDVLEYESDIVEDVLEDVFAYH